jgi:hypothetical protein
MKCILPFIILLYAGSALADDLMRLPVPEVKDGMACVDTEGWRTIMLIANEYQGLSKWRLEIGDALERYSDLQVLHAQQIANFERMFKIYESELAYQKERVKELEKATSGKSLERYLLWGAVVLETAVIGALGIHVAMQ